MQQFKRDCEVSLKFVKRCRFGFSGNQKWKDLIESLKEFNSNLYRLGLAAMRILLAIPRLPANRTDGRNLIRAARYEAKDPGPRNEDYRQLLQALMVKFRQQPRPRDLRRVRRFERVRIRSNYFRFSDDEGRETATMGSITLDSITQGREHHAVLVEWINLQGMPGRKEETLRISFLLRKLELDLILLPSSFGVFRDPGEDRLGIVLALPLDFGRLGANPESGAVSERRRPESLASLMTPNQENLGRRFKIARMLADAVHVMHLVGYVHKLSL